MKPITTTNPEGRALLALRAGPMTMGEVGARIGTSLPGWLLKAGYVVLDDSHYRITEAGRAACPYRNPLAAPGIVPPARYSPEIEMPRGIITRQQVLAVINEAGAAGVSKADLVARFGNNDCSVTGHLFQLKKDEAISNSSRGMWVAADPKSEPTPQSKSATAQAAPSTKFRHPTRVNVLAWLHQMREPKSVTDIADGIDAGLEGTLEVCDGLYRDLVIERCGSKPSYLYYTSTAARKPGFQLSGGDAPAQAKEEAPVADTPAVIRAPKDSPAIKSITTPLAETLHDLGLGNLEDLGDLKMPDEAFETIEIKAIPDRRAAVASEILISAPALIEDVHLDNPDDVEFAVFSSGGMDIYCAETTVTLNKAVLGKLRAFLGLFQEAA